MTFVTQLLSNYDHVTMCGKEPGITSTFGNITFKCITSHHVHFVSIGFRYKVLDYLEKPAAKV